MINDWKDFAQLIQRDPPQRCLELLKFLLKESVSYEKLQAKLPQI